MELTVNIADKNFQASAIQKDTLNAGNTKVCPVDLSTYRIIVNSKRIKGRVWSTRDDGEIEGICLSYVDPWRELVGHKYKIGGTYCLKIKIIQNY